MVRELKPALAIGLLVVPLLAPLAAQNAGMSPQAPPDESVPSDLRPLVAPAQSEMRLVTQRYAAEWLLCGTSRRLRSLASGFLRCSTPPSTGAFAHCT